MALPASESEIRIENPVVLGGEEKGSAKKMTNATPGWLIYLGGGLLVGLLLINTITLIVFAVSFNNAMSTLGTELGKTQTEMGAKLASSAMFSSLGLTASASGGSDDASLSQTMMKMASGSIEEFNGIESAYGIPAIQWAGFAANMGLLLNESIFELISNILKALDPGSLCKKIMSWADAIFDASDRRSVIWGLQPSYTQDVVPFLKQCATVKPYLSPDERNSLTSPISKFVFQLQNWLERNFESEHTFQMSSIVLHYLNEMAWLFKDGLEMDELYSLFDLDKEKSLAD